MPGFLLVAEFTRPRGGTDAAVLALLETLLLFALRTWFENQATPTGWAGAFTDPDVLAVLRAIHDAPERAPQRRIRYLGSVASAVRNPTEPAW